MLKDCVNPVAYWQCISQRNGKCLHTGPCESIDNEGVRYTMVALKEYGRTICYFRNPITAQNIESDEKALHNSLTRGRVLHQIINADTANESLRLVRILKEQKGPVIVREEPVASPHPFMDPVIEALKEQKRMAAHIQMFCGHCMDCSDCTIAGELSALDRCLKVSRNRAFLMSLEVQRCR